MAIGIIARRLVGRTALMLGVTTAFAMCAGASTAITSPSAHTSGPIAIYVNVASAVNSTYMPNPLRVRPSGLLLTEDGSVVLEHLRWLTWGSSVARATGALSTTNCTPDCATGKRTKRLARLTLSRPGRVLGHEVYRCFQMTIPSSPASDVHECLRRMGTLIVYSAASTPKSPTTKPSPTPSSAMFYFTPGGWFCSMAQQAVRCEQSAKGYTTSLFPAGTVINCTAGPAACRVGNPGMHDTIRPGSRVIVKPFRCSYTTAGLTCTVIRTGRGFRIEMNGRVASVR